MITKIDFDAKLKKISDRVTNNKSKDLLLDNELKKLKTLDDSTAKIKFDEVQKENSFKRGFFYYLQQSYLVCECKMDSLNFTSKKISKWKSTGIFIYSDDSTIRGGGVGGVIHVSSPLISNGKVINVLHMNTLIDLFPEYDFNDKVRGENQQEHDDSLQSSYCIFFFLIDLRLCCVFCLNLLLLYYY